MDLFVIYLLALSGIVACIATAFGIVTLVVFCVNRIWGNEDEDDGDYDFDYHRTPRVSMISSRINCGMIADQDIQLDDIRSLPCMVWFGSMLLLGVFLKFHLKLNIFRLENLLEMNFFIWLAVFFLKECFSILIFICFASLNLA